MRQMCMTIRRPASSVLRYPPESKFRNAVRGAAHHAVAILLDRSADSVTGVASGSPSRPCALLVLGSGSGWRTCA